MSLFEFIQVWQTWHTFGTQILIMKTKLSREPDSEIRYLRFLNNTLQIEQMREDICDEFTGKIFDYLEGKPLFDAQVFCAFIYNFIFKCQLQSNLVMTAEHNLQDKVNLNAGKIADELFLYLDLFSQNFALSSVDVHQFQPFSLEEKLKHLIEIDAPTWKTARVKIIEPELRGNAAYFSYVDIEFKQPPLSVRQKLDIIHFAICALNYLSWNGEPIVAGYNPEISSKVYVSKPEHLKVVSDNLNRVRDSVILNAVRDKETDDEELNNLEFDPNEPTMARIIKAQNQDPKLEKQWLDENSPVFVKSEIEVVAERPAKTKGYPPHYLQQIIDTAVRLYEQNDRVRASDIYQELHIEKNTYNTRIKFFGYDTAMILEQARNKIRESEEREK